MEQADAASVNRTALINWQRQWRLKNADKGSDPAAKEWLKKYGHDGDGKPPPTPTLLQIQTQQAVNNFAIQDFTAKAKQGYTVAKDGTLIGPDGKPVAGGLFGNQTVDPKYQYIFAGKTDSAKTPDFSNPLWWLQGVFQPNTNPLAYQPPQDTRPVDAQSIWIWKDREDNDFGGYGGSFPPDSHSQSLDEWIHTTLNSVVNSPVYKGIMVIGSVAMMVPAAAEGMDAINASFAQLQERLGLIVSEAEAEIEAVIAEESAALTAEEDAAVGSEAYGIQATPPPGNPQDDIEVGQPVRGLDNTRYTRTRNNNPQAQEYEELATGRPIPGIAIEVDVEGFKRPVEFDWVVEGGEGPVLVDAKMSNPEGWYDLSQEQFSGHFELLKRQLIATARRQVAALESSGAVAIEWRVADETIRDKIQSWFDDNGITDIVVQVIERDNHGE